MQAGNRPRVLLIIRDDEPIDFFLNFVRFFLLCQRQAASAVDPELKTSISRKKNILIPRCHYCIQPKRYPASLLCSSEKYSVMQPPLPNTGMEAKCMDDMFSESSAVPSSPNRIFCRHRKQAGKILPLRTHVRNGYDFRSEPVIGRPFFCIQYAFHKKCTNYLKKTNRIHVDSPWIL